MNFRKTLIERKPTCYYPDFNSEKVVEVTPLRIVGNSICWTSTDRSFDHSLLSPSEVYLTYEGARKFLDTYNTQRSSFAHRPWLPPRVLAAHYDDLRAIETAIETALYDVPSFNGVDFVHTYDDHIQIRTFHKAFDYKFGVASEINPDFSNIEEATKFAIDQFRSNNNSTTTKLLISFFESGDKYGWD